MFWSGWHLPLFFIRGTFQNQIGLGSAAALFFVAIVIQSVLYAWVYLGTGRSILAAVLFHVAQNVGGEFVSAPGAEVVELAVSAALAVAITVGWRRWMLAPGPSE